MSQQTTIRKLAALVNTPVDKLLEQLAEAGMSFNDPDQVVTSTEKVKLLGFLRRTHGKAEQVAEDTAAPKKITLNRSRKQELTVGGGKNKQTVDVVVRKRVTLVKSPAAAGAGAESTAPVNDEHAEILRKLEESKQRNLSEQKQLAEQDRKRAEDAAEQRRRAEEEAARLRAEAELAAAAAGTDEDGAPRKVAGHHTHGHGHPKPAAPRGDDRLGPKHKGNRGSHAMVASVEDDDNTARFAGQLHLSAAERARRTTSTRGKSRPRRQVDQSRTGTGFNRPTAPIVR
jgi:translation initiation factor IF-2